jgi:hypothetical protein
MCFMPKAAAYKPALSLIPSANNRETYDQQTLEQRLRRTRAGAAANVLTSPVGIPAVDQLGAVA